MNDTIQLNTGKTMPRNGFGTWEITPDKAAEQLVGSALELGYRLIDTAKIYGNEKGVGQALQIGGVPREELFVTSKLWNTDHGYKSTHEAYEESLKNLQLEYLDLYLIHWPATPERHESWRAMEELFNSGKVRAVGVSNYTVSHLEQLLASSSLVPVVNQVEFHPFIYEQQYELLEYCRQKGIVIEAYSPLSRLGDTNNEVIESIAKLYNKTPQQIVLRWCLQHDTVPLSRTTSTEHMKENFAVFNFELSDSDMTALDSISDGKRVTTDPANMID